MSNDRLKDQIEAFLYAQTLPNTPIGCIADELAQLFNELFGLKEGGWLNAYEPGCTAEQFGRFESSIERLLVAGRDSNKSDEFIAEALIVHINTIHPMWGMPWLEAETQRTIIERSSMYRRFIDAALSTGPATEQPEEAPLKFGL